MMMEGRGIEMIDLGVDVPPARFLDEARQSGASIVCCSALLTTTMDEMKNTVNAFIDAGIRDKAIIMVGGAPVTDNLRKDAGADYYAIDAATGAEIAKKAILDKKGA
jgi:5-methyltetrahydrofolate--homocysteine methyltransferase